MSECSYCRYCPTTETTKTVVEGDDEIDEVLALKSCTRCKQVAYCSRQCQQVRFVYSFIFLGHF
jgi:hypothetical protein